MPNQKHIEDKAFFSLLDEVELARLDRSKGTWPWEQRVHGEDRAAAESHMFDAYAKLNLARPKVAWASSPASLWSALAMLRTFPMKQSLIDSLIPSRGLVSIEGEAKRTMLAAIIDDAVMASTGAPIARMLNWKRWDSPPRVHQAIDDADSLISHASRATDALGRSTTPGKWAEARIYPVLHSEGAGHLAANAFCVLPFVKLCLFCLPPLFVKTDPYGNLHSEDGPAIKWADGYELNRIYEAPPALPEPDSDEALEARFGRVNPDNPTVKLLNGAVSGLVKKNLEGK